MKKNVIAVMLSLVLAIGSVGAPVFAAEDTTAQGAVEDSVEGMTEEESTPEEEEEVSNEGTSESDDEEEGSEEGATESEKEDDADSVEETEATSEKDEDEPVAEEEVDADLIQEEAAKSEQAGDIIDSGRCGADGDKFVTWTLTGTDTDMTLTISGSVEMDDYEKCEDDYDTSECTPWESYKVNIKTVCVENGVTAIGNYAFSGCSNLTDVTISDSVTRIGHNAFSGCSSLPNVMIPDSVTSIWTSVFEDCSSLMSVTIPDSVTSIGASAFENCISLTSVTIGNGVSEIGISAFGNCSNLTGVTIGNSVRDIMQGAFGNCSNLTSVTIPNSVKYIGNYVFYGCSSLISVTIGDSVTSIGDFAFSGCSGLQNIMIPDSVTNIGERAFYECSNLTSVAIGSGVTSFGLNTFEGCSSLTSVTIGNGVTSIGERTFYECSNLTSVTIPDSVTSIGNSAFSGCSGLTSVTIGNSVTSIGDSAFSECRSLTSVTIGSSVTSIGVGAFYGCISLTDVTIPDSVTSIGGSAFRLCENLTSMTIPDSVESIGGYAFENCSNLTSVTIGNGVTSIGSSAFSDCSSLTSVMIGNGVTSIGSYAFSDCSNLTSVTIPDSVTSIGSYAFSGCRNLKSVTIPDSVTSILERTFSGCSNLKRVTIGNSVPIIGDYAFSRCGSLTSVKIPDSVTSIRNYAFWNCDSLSDIYYAGSQEEWGQIKWIGDACIPNKATIHFNWAGEIPADGVQYITATLGEETYPFNGKPVEPTPTVTLTMTTEDGTETRELSQDEYSITYENNDKPGKATLTVSGTGEYSGLSDTVEFTINSVVGVRYITAVLDNKIYKYEGKPVEPKPTVYYYETTEEGEEEKELTESEYTITYKDNDKPGKATLTVTGIGDYTGSFELSFTIVEDIIALEYLEVGIGGNVTVHWTYSGEADAITGFEVQHRWKGSDGIRTTKVSGSNKREVDIVNLSYNDYEFRVRAVSSSGEESEDSAWTDWAECPVKEIKILNPEVGAKNVDSFGFSGKIDFGTNFRTIDGKEACIYEAGNSESPAIKISFEEMYYMDELPLQSDIPVFTYNDINSQNPSKIEKLSAGKTYHVGIDANAIEYLNTENDPINASVPVYFAGIDKSDNNKWSFSTINLSYPGMENPGEFAHHLIPEKYYRLLFEEQDWKTIRGKDDGSGGICFGLCYTAGAYKHGFSYIQRIVSDSLMLPDISSHTGYASLADVPIGETSKLLEYIRMAHLFQYRPEYKDIEKETKVEGLYNAIQGGEDVIISLRKSSWNTEGHVVYSPGVLSGGNSSSVSIPVYDSARGNSSSFVKTLKLSADGKSMEPFGEYKHYNWYYEIDPIVDSLIDNYVNSLDYALLSYEDYRLMTSTKELGNQENLNAIQPENGDSDDEGLYLYWLKGDSYHIDGDDEDITVTLSDGTNKIYATLAAEQSATLDIENKLVTIDGAEAGGTAGDYVIRFSEAEDYDTFHDMEISGTSGNEDTKLTKTDDGITVDTDAGAEIIVRKIENNENTAEVKVELPEDKAEIRTDDNGKISVYADKDGDGEFTDVIAVSGNSGTTEIVASGTCGENLTWSLDEEGTLTISGAGEMANYRGRQEIDLEVTYSSNSPWFDYGIKTVIIEDGVTSIGRAAFCGCGKLERAEIPDSVTTIGEWAFSGCGSLDCIEIPEGVTSIGEKLFAYCINLRSVAIPVGVRSIGNSAFISCKKLTDIEIPPNVTTIGAWAFIGCNSLTDIIIPEGIKTISGSLFEDCFNLVSVTIPNSVTSIKEDAFNKCNGLTDIYYGGSRKSWDAISIGNNNTALTDATLHLSLANAEVSGLTNKTYTGKAITQNPVVTLCGETLLEGTDYRVSYANNTNAGTATVNIIGVVNYEGTVTTTFNINKAANKITASNRTLSYSTKARSLSLNVKATAGKISYKSNNTKVKVTSAGKVTIPAKFSGTAKITITAAGSSNYNKGTKTITITVPAKITLSSVSSPSAGKMRVVWKKNTSVTGYQIQYSLKSSFASPKTVTIGKNTQYAKTFSGLTRGKKYYVRIRSYKTVSGKKYYSAWSATKATTIKK